MSNSKFDLPYSTLEFRRHTRPVRRIRLRDIPSDIQPAMAANHGTRWRMGAKADHLGFLLRAIARLRFLEGRRRCAPQSLSAAPSRLPSRLPERPPLRRVGRASQGVEALRLRRSRFRHARATSELGRSVLQVVLTTRPQICPEAAMRFRGHLSNVSPRRSSSCEDGAPRRYRMRRRTQAPRGREMRRPD